MLNFLVKYNYEFSSDADNQTESELTIMGVHKNQSLSDSVKGNTIKKREMKHNSKIQ